VSRFDAEKVAAGVRGLNGVADQLDEQAAVWREQCERALGAMPAGVPSNDGFRAGFMPGAEDFMTGMKSSADFLRGLAQTLNAARAGFSGTEAANAAGISAAGGGGGVG